jgi:hypothetical protein
VSVRVCVRMYACMGAVWNLLWMWRKSRDLVDLTSVCVCVCIYTCACTYAVWMLLWIWQRSRDLVGLTSVCVCVCVYVFVHVCKLL